MSTDDKLTAKGDPWDAGTLGRDAQHARRVSPEQESAVDEAIGLQMISIRLPKKQLEALKLLAKLNGIGYQPLIRDVLHRFIEQELKSIARDMSARRQREEEERVQREAAEREELERNRLDADGSRMAA